MSEECEKIQEQMLQYVTGELSAQEAQSLERHIEQCSACKEYLEALQSDDKLLGDFTEALQPSISQIQESVIGELGGISQEKSSLAVNARWIRFAAAAVILVAGGYVLGWLFRPQQVDVEQLLAELVPAIRQDLLAELDSRWQDQFAVTCTQLKNELAYQVQRDLTEFAAQTLTASKTLTDRRIVELVQLIEAARLRDRQRVTAALEKVELNRLRDKVEFANNLQTLKVPVSEVSSMEIN